MVSGKLNQRSYLELLNDVALVAGSKMIGLEFIFQQDNVPAHKGFLVTKFLNDFGPTTHKLTTAKPGFKHHRKCLGLFKTKYTII